MPTLPRYYEEKELADALGVHVITARRLRVQQDWPHSRVGGRIRYSEEDIASIRERLKAEPAPKPGRPRRAS